MILTIPSNNFIKLFLLLVLLGVSHCVPTPETTMQKVVIFGSTGQTGLCVVKKALEKGLNVRAFVRDPQKLPEDLRNSVEVVQGNVLNYDDVRAAVQNVTGVIITLGTRNILDPTTDLSEGTKNIIRAMKESNVEVVSVCLSAFLFYEPEKVPRIFWNINADHQRMYDAVKESELKYIAVFPPHIADIPSGTVEVVHDSSPGRSVSKWDLAEFLIDSLSKPSHYGRVCGIRTIPQNVD